MIRHMIGVCKTVVQFSVLSLNFNMILNQFCMSFVNKMHGKQKTVNDHSANSEDGCNYSDRQRQVFYCYI